MAKVRPTGHMRPSKDFLRPLRQVLDAPLSYLDTIMQAKHLELTSIVSHFKKNEPNILQPPIQYFTEIWPARKKVWPPLSLLFCYVWCSSESR